jgi:restriction system protein
MTILEEIKKNIPNRFADMTPHHFEEFICEFLKDSGYQAEITKSTGDFGADIILTKDNLRTAVQVKKYERENLVGVKEINQVIGGREYYKCDKAIIVTTSDFTKAAKKLAEQTGVELWNWDKLYNEIKKIYLGGKDVYEFFTQKNLVSTLTQVTTQKGLQNKKFSFQIEKIRENVYTVREGGRRNGDISTIVHIKMTNTKDEKIYVTIAYPIIITTLNNQIEANSWFVGIFKGGYIYPHASVPLIFCWYRDQVPKGKLIKKVIVKYQEEGGENREEFVYPDSSQKL